MKQLQLPSRNRATDERTREDGNGGVTSPQAQAARRQKERKREGTNLTSLIARSWIRSIRRIDNNFRELKPGTEIYTYNTLLKATASHPPHSTV